MEQSEIAKGLKDIAFSATVGKDLKDFEDIAENAMPNGAESLSPEGMSNPARGQ